MFSVLVRYTASMEPRLGSRGKWIAVCGPCHEAIASMEPRLGSRGKPRCYLRLATLRHSLQWSRDLEVAERAMPFYRPSIPPQASMEPRLGSRGKLGRQDDRLDGSEASMEPRLGSRGKRKHPSRWGLDRSRFNGAATWKSRKAVGSTDTSGQGNPCFNGAATWKSRKDGLQKIEDFQNLSFNGAATWKSRKADWLRHARTRAARLQWSRDLEVAERNTGRTGGLGVGELQWSRDLEVAERRVGLLCEYQRA